MEGSESAVTLFEVKKAPTIVAAEKPIIDPYAKLLSLPMDKSRGF